MRLTRFSIVAGSLVCMFAGATAVYVELSHTAANVAATQLFQDATGDLIAASDLASAVQDIKYDVVQVQQFLTDVSATRALDGLDDGYANAKQFAETFASDVEKARGLATTIDEKAVLDDLEAVAKAFGPYYETGQKMAQAYVANGPEAGNALMSGFDATAEQMANAVDVMVKDVTDFGDRIRAENVKRLRDLQDSQWFVQVVQLVTYAALMIFIVAMTAFFAGYALRRILAMSRSMQAIAEGDHSHKVYGSSVWEELKDIALSADIFRKNGIRLAELQAEDAEKSAQTARDRKAILSNLRNAFGGVVEAAVDGDFSKRVPENADDEDLRALAGSVNRLVERVGVTVAETRDVVSAMASADLTVRMKGEYHGAFAELKDNINHLAESLTDIVGQLRGTSRGVKTAMSEILSGANDLADRTTKQAAAIEETSAAIEQLSTTVTANAKRAEEASLASRGVSQTAEQTGEVMQRSNAAMERITQSSARISNIIGLIDDVAFQTNLLALNASVEAARAGDAGKGFAVVAVEVRRLAQSAAQASSEVKALIEQSAAEVTAGSKLVAEASGRLASMVESVRQSAVLVQDISAASQDQASSISQVFTAIRQMDEMTQHNAALVEETNAAIEQTENQANELDRIVEQFAVDGPKEPLAGKTLQKPTSAAARTYLRQGNTALKAEADWAEF